MKKVKMTILSIFVLFVLALNVSVFVPKDGNSSVFISLKQLTALAGGDLETIPPKIPDQKTVSCGTPLNPGSETTCPGEGNGCVPNPCH